MLEKFKKAKSSDDNNEKKTGLASILSLGGATKANAGSGSTHKPVNPSVAGQLHGQLKNFGGMTATQIISDIKNASTKSGSALSQPKVPESAKIAIESVKNIGGSTGMMSQNTKISVAATNSLIEEIATLYAENETKHATEILLKFINVHKGNVDKRFWYLLMDIYQFTNQKQFFEKAAASFANTFSISPPSWIAMEEAKKTVMAGRNVLTLDGVLQMSFSDKFKDFIKAAREEKFCRIDASRTKFEQSEVGAIELLLKSMGELRKHKVLSVLLGENNIIQLCKQYINPNKENKNLNQTFTHNEPLFWLLNLEVLQWRGRFEDFESLALEYAMKFEQSPPGYEESGVMRVEESVIKRNMEETDSEHLKLVERNINSSNLGLLFEIIEGQLKLGNKAEVELAHVERIDFASAGSIAHYLQDIQLKEEYSNKKIIFQNPNEPILALLEMVGVTEFLEIDAKQR